MSLEVFATIPGYEDRYQVSTWGRVFDSLRNKFVYQEETKKGYLRVNLFMPNGYRQHHKVHRLVAQAFIENPHNKPQVNHIDGNKQNNSVTNLEWVTNEENRLKAEELSNYIRSKVAQKGDL